MTPYLRGRVRQWLKESDTDEGKEGAEAGWRGWCGIDFSLSVWPAGLSFISLSPVYPPPLITQGESLFVAAVPPLTLMFNSHRVVFVHHLWIANLLIFFFFPPPCQKEKYFNQCSLIPVWSINKHLSADFKFNVLTVSRYVSKKHGTTYAPFPRT